MRRSRLPGRTPGTNMGNPLTDDIAVADAFDAGFIGCGELVMVLRLRLKAIPGQVIRVVARDSGALEDLPAWCRMTQNELIAHDPETHTFWIRARTDWT